MIRLIIMAAIAVSLASSAMGNSDLMLLHVGPAAGSGTPAVACGTGIIDLSAGCILPVNLGLVP